MILQRKRQAPPQYILNFSGCGKRALTSECQRVCVKDTVIQTNRAIRGENYLVSEAVLEI